MHFVEKRRRRAKTEHDFNVRFGVYIHSIFTKAPDSFEEVRYFSAMRKVHIYFA